jgi:hypothetical protein
MFLIAINVVNCLLELYLNFTERKALNDWWGKLSDYINVIVTVTQQTVKIRNRFLKNFEKLLNSTIDISNSDTSRLIFNNKKQLILYPDFLHKTCYTITFFILVKRLVSLTSIGSLCMSDNNE